MSTKTTRHTIRRRPTRSIPAIIVALVLLAVAIGAVWAGITALTGGSTGVIESATVAAGTPWSAQAAFIPSIAVAIIGLVLILTALVPGHHDAHLVDHPGTAEAALTRRGLRTYLDDQASDVDGVDSARTTVKGRKTDVRVGTYALDHRAVGSDVRRTLQGRTDALNLKHAPRVRVHTTTLKD